MNFRQLEIYESLKGSLNNTKDIKISKLYGNNGEIAQKEIENIQKNFCELNVKN